MVNTLTMTYQETVILKKSAKADVLSAFALVSLPRHLELSPVVGTVSQIKVDQGLIRDSLSFSQGLEVVDSAAIDIDGDLLLQPARIGVFPWIQFADVVFISHNITSNSIKISTLLGFGCLPCRDNTDAVFLVTIAMAHNANFFRLDRSDDQEAFFLNGVIRIVKQDSELVVKDLLCCLER